MTAPPSEDRMDPIPEGGGGGSAEIGTSPRRRSNNSMEGPRISASGLRPRVGTITGRPRRSTFNRRPSIAVAAISTGRDLQESQSVTNFSVAGASPIDIVAAHQAYVDPHYTHLNPAYDQPVNARPVWGLAKPLPRVVRPGMVPTRSELMAGQVQPATEQPEQDPANEDLEQGRIEPTLRVDKISSQLQNTREQRENSLLRTLSRTGLSPLSNLRRDSSSVAGPFSPTSEAIEEEEDTGFRQPVDLKEEHPNLDQQDNRAFPAPHWYPDDAASAITEQAQEGDLDGDDLYHEDIPLAAYDAEADEIHNLHTHWSVIRLRFREPLAELLAVSLPSISHKFQSKKTSGCIDACRLPRSRCS